MCAKSATFPLSLDELRSIGGWAADCVGRTLPLFEQHALADTRPRAALEGIRDFAAGGKRSAQLRVLALAALAAAREVTGPAAAAAARAAGFAAASAYTHPLADVQQTKHILGPAAYAALALELSQGDPAAAAAEVRRAVESIPAAARAVLLRMPARSPGKSRADRLMYDLDTAIRARPETPPPGAA